MITPSGRRRYHFEKVLLKSFVTAASHLPLKLDIIGNKLNEKNSSLFVINYSLLIHRVKANS